MLFSLPCIISLSELSWSLVTTVKIYRHSEMATAITRTNRPLPHYAPVSKRKEMRMRLGWTISNKSLYFVHPSLELMPFFKGMRVRSIQLEILLRLLFARQEITFYYWLENESEVVGVAVIEFQVNVLLAIKPPDFIFMKLYRKLFQT